VVVGRLQLCWLGVMGPVAFFCCRCSQGRGAERAFVGVGVVRGARCLASLGQAASASAVGPGGPHGPRRSVGGERLSLSAVQLLHPIALHRPPSHAILGSVMSRERISASPWWGVLLFPAPLVQLLRWRLVSLLSLPLLGYRSLSPGCVSFAFVPDPVEPW
jgi:hypothetical protein